MKGLFSVLLFSISVLKGVQEPFGDQSGISESASEMAISEYQSPPVVINEFLASNNENLADEDGDYEDWIELYNAGTEEVSLWGFGLTDRTGDYFRWVFPDTTIGPGDFMIVWASGKDRRTPGKPLHTGFRISKEGEPLRLSEPGGELVDTVPPVYVPTDYSYGRKPDGSDQWDYFAVPTPGSPNTTGSFEQLLEPPEFSHEGGFYEEPFYLTLSLPDHSEGAEIYYSTDGSTPGPGKGILYQDSIFIENRTDEPNDISMIPTNNYGPGNRYNEDWKEPVGNVFKGTVIRAVTVAPDGESPAAITRTFFVAPDLEDRYRLPVVSLVTDRGHFFSWDDGIYVNENYHESGEKSERPVHFEFFETGGVPVLAQDAGVRIHGGTSRNRPVKSLRMYARRSYGESWFEYPLIPDAPVDRYKRFLLRNSGNDWDGTYFRDALMQELVAHTPVETQYYRPVVVFINGEYWGIHNLRKRYDHRYFETMYGLDREDLAYLEGNAVIKDGIAADRRHFTDLRDLLANDDVNSSHTWRIVEDRMDVENFRDYHIANIYFRNTDWPGNNIDFWRKRTDGPVEDASPGHDGRWRWLLYDTDFGFNLDFDYVWGVEERAGHNTLRFAIEGSNNSWPNPQWSVSMLRGALRNHEFRNDFINRFADLLNTAFSEERVLKEIDTMYDVLEPHMREHIRRWLGPPSMHEWESEVESMREFARERPEAQREHIVSQFNLAGTAVVTLDVNKPQGGYITVNTVDVRPGETGVPDEPWPWTGIYFRNVPVTLKAEPEEGYIFDGWEGMEGSGKELIIDPQSDTGPYKALFKAGDVSSGNGREKTDFPETFTVSQPRPNPFNNQAMITVSMPDNAHVSMKAYTVDGRKIATLHEGVLQTGTHDLRIEAAGWASGIYVIVLDADSWREAFPVTLVK